MKDSCNPSFISHKIPLKNKKAIQNVNRIAFHSYSIPDFLLAFTGIAALPEYAYHIYIM